MLSVAGAGGLPHPNIHDEFSYLLGADTFASGRLANPRHPLWEFFETIHVLSQPTYAPKYPPGQALFLAAGQITFGHPYYGVVLSTALLMAALCWMLQAWLSPAWGLLGGALAVVCICCGHYWSVSYWGGSVAALGGSLCLTAYRKLTQGASRSAGWLSGLGVILVIWTRPFEGGLLLVALALGAVFHVRGLPVRARALLVRRAAPSMLGVIGLGLCFQAIYNHAVTGSYLTLPYALALQQYHVVPVLWPLPMAPPKTYRLDVLRMQFADWEPLMYLQIRRMPLPQQLSFLIQRVWDGVHELVPITFILPVIVVFWRDPKAKFLTLTALWGAAGLCLETWLYPHYLAPWFPLALLLCFTALRNISQIRWRGTRAGATFAAVTLMIAFVAGGLRAATEIHYYIHPEGVRFNVGRERANLSGQLVRSGGQHVILVRYSPLHRVGQEWVYNGANIDAAGVIWAHDRGAAQNRKLVEYYARRNIWLFEPDANPPAFRRYPGE